VLFFPCDIFSVKQGVIGILIMHASQVALGGLAGKAANARNFFFHSPPLIN